MLYNSTDKKVSHPSHYQSIKGIEVIDVEEAFTEGLNGIEAADTSNIIKYACRWKNKNGIQDLEKILWYTQHLIDYLERGKTKNIIEDQKYMESRDQNNNIKFVKNKVNSGAISGHYESDTDETNIND